MNLLDRIDKALVDGGEPIHPDVFESCALSLLSEFYPNLVPVHGGSDRGEDGHIGARGSEPAISVIVSSTRKWKSARASVRGSLRSAQKNGTTPERILIVNLVEMTARQRESLRLLAREFRVEVVQLYGRGFFANALRRDPSWRAKLIGIRGGSMSLARPSQALEAFEVDRLTIGRSEELTELATAARDVIAWGVPGAGKSHLVAQVAGALLLDGSPSSEQLIDDLIETDPPCVIVDDAGGRLDQLAALARLRRAEQLRFRVIATCWPHELGQVGDAIPDSQLLHVERLTTEQIGQIIRSRGVDELEIIGLIIEQARGRPAWALLLTDLLLSRAQLHHSSVFTGEALRTQVLRYLRRSHTPSEATDVLGVISLIGEMHTADIATLAGLLGMSRPRLMEILRAVAVSGILDADRAGNNAYPTYRVAPPILATSLAAEHFFAEHAMPVLELDEILHCWPERLPRVTLARIQAHLVDPAAASPTPDEFTAAVNAAKTLAERNKLRLHYLHVGERQAMVALAAALSEVAKSQSASTVEHGVDVARRSFALHRDATSLRAAAHLAAVSADPPKIAEDFVDGLRRPSTGGSLRVDLLICAARTALEELETVGTPFAVALAAAAMSPTFEDNITSPEHRLQFVLRTFTLRGFHMDQLRNDVLNDLLRTIDPSDPIKVSLVIGLLDDYAHLASGHFVRFGHRPDAEQVAGARRFAEELADAIATWPLSPGLRARSRNSFKLLGRSLREPDDLARAILGRERWKKNGDLLSTHTRTVDKARSAIGKALDGPPDKLLGRLESILEDAEQHGVHVGSRPHVVMGVVASDVTALKPWLKAALARPRIAPFASPVARTLLERGEVSSQEIVAYFKTPVLRSTVVDHALVTDDDSPFKAIAELLEPEDATAAAIAVTRTESRDRSTDLLTKTSTKFRGAFAMALAGWSSDFVGAFGPEWKAAIGYYTFDDAVESWNQEEGLKFLAKHAPRTYADLLYRNVDPTDDASAYRLFDDWDGSAHLLPADLRSEIWRKYRALRGSSELFAVLANDDVAWIKSTLDAGLASPASLLSGVRFRFKTSLDVSDLARLLVPRGVDPLAVAKTVEWGMQEGEDHERLERHLATMRALTKSEESELFEVGLAGVRYFEPRHGVAVKRHRQAEIEGAAPW